jgi:transposase
MRQNLKEHFARLRGGPVNSASDTALIRVMTVTSSRSRVGESTGDLRNCSRASHFWTAVLLRQKKRGAGVGKTKQGKGTKWMVVVDGRGVPLGNYLHSASPAEVRLAETTLAAIRVGRTHHAWRPRQKLCARSLTRPTTKTNRIRAATQDVRGPRRYQRRWIVERTNAWLGNFQRLVVRYDRSLKIYGPFFHIECFMIVLRRVVQ